MATDWVTEQLRKAFIKINAKAERAETKRRKRSEAKAKAQAKAKAAKESEAWALSQRVRPCHECGKPAKADPEFFLNPVICPKCKDRSRDVDLGIHPRKRDDFSEITVFKGGAPGLGRRK
ncbi:hypothetical protein CMV24_29440 [Pseudomonas plecoglossicida]|uniref:Uncharacterized protein n=1 Tax=Pseudomonas plecoglossicida TaxID=70775 RepID=A0A2A3LVU1_PSEDL|nr:MULTISPECIES: hypothetical protein [Pseudomonas]PBJ91990.1 hypothetical protein CMV24_29440 [Pseudomonas plecoglossicida]PIK74998.1 hypothetical protein CQW31_29740 [Pseudomonas sp. 382]POG01028.1 hypothetical protein BGP83_27535 [Pseudomonas putida]